VYVTEKEKVVMSQDGSPVSDPTFLQGLKNLWEDKWTGVAILAGGFVLIVLALLAAQCGYVLPIDNP
jgi:hypothetical protein